MGAASEAPLGVASEAAPAAAATDGESEGGGAHESDAPTQASANVVMDGKTQYMAELPEATVSDEDFESFTERVHETLRERGMSQNSVCSQLALSPVYFSIWLRQRPVSMRCPSRTSS